VESFDLASLTDSGRTKLRAKTVSFVFQKFNLLPNLTAQQNIDLARYFGGTGKSDAQFDSILEKLGIAHRLDHLPSELSGGEQQRVAIARALAGSPELLIADEPTGQLDSETGNQIMRLLRTVVRSEGVTALVATHDPMLIDLADTVLMLEDGKIVEN